MPNELKIISKFKLKGDKIFKIAKQHFFLPKPPKKAKNMPNYDVHGCQAAFSHVKPPYKRPKFRNLALKMPTWQPCWLLSYLIPMTKPDNYVTVRRSPVAGTLFLSSPFFVY